jgi:hypothetical protein
MLMKRTTLCPPATNWCSRKEVNSIAAASFFFLLSQISREHNEGWMILGLETVFCWVPVPQLTMVVILNSVAVFF